MANTYNICNKLQAIADAITQGGGGGGGTTVIANPTGTPTADLNTVQIGQVIYDIPGGGGGSGYSETTLWSGAPTTTSITLSDSVLNYDAIYCEGKFNNEAYMVETIDKATFTSYLGNDYISLGTHGGAYYGLTPASTATHFVFFGANYNGCTRVIGIKYARGGGSDQAVDINYDNTTSGLTATNVQDAIDENASDISTLNSNISLINREYVEITTVAGDTNASGLTKLFNAIDVNKLTYKSVVYIAGTCFNIDSGTIDGANTYFNMSSVPILNSSSVVIDRVLFRASSPQYYRATIKASPAFAFTDYTSQSIGAGISIRLYY